MGIDRESEISADLQIGPTTLGMVRIYVVAEGLDLPLDFDPEEAEEIAEELRAAAARARDMAVRARDGSVVEKVVVSNMPRRIQSVGGRIPEPPEVAAPNPPDAPVAAPKAGPERTDLPYRRPEPVRAQPAVRREPRKPDARPGGGKPPMRKGPERVGGGFGRSSGGEAAEGRGRGEDGGSPGRGGFGRGPGGPKGDSRKPGFRKERQGGGESGRESAPEGSRGYARRSDDAKPSPDRRPGGKPPAGRGGFGKGPGGNGPGGARPEGRGPGGKGPRTGGPGGRPGGSRS